MKGPALFGALVVGPLRGNALRALVTLVAVALGVAIGLAIDLANATQIPLSGSTEVPEMVPPLRTSAATWATSRPATPGRSSP